MNPAAYFWSLLKASLFSTGGMGNLPSISHDFIAAHAASPATFGEALVIGQFSPGPNGLWTVAFGYLTAGPTGALLAAIAVSIPPFLVLLLDRFYARNRDSAAVTGFIRGISFGVIGAFAVTLIGMLRDSHTGHRGIITLAVALALVTQRRFKVPMPIIIAASAMPGILWP
jgi:chromate transporter